MGHFLPTGVVIIIIMSRIPQSSLSSSSSNSTRKSFLIDDLLQDETNGNTSSETSTANFFSQHPVTLLEQDSATGTHHNNVSSALNALIHMASYKISKMHRDYLEKKSFIDPALTAFYTRPECMKKRRKARTAFNQHQICRLELHFQKQRYLSHTDRDRLARQLGITSSQVITWFQNRRAKMKREAMELQNDLLATQSSGSSTEATGNFVGGLQESTALHGVLRRLSSSTSPSPSANHSTSSSRIRTTREETSSGHQSPP